MCLKTLFVHELDVSTDLLEATDRTQSKVCKRKPVIVRRYMTENYMIMRF